MKEFLEKIKNYVRADGFSHIVVSALIMVFFGWLPLWLAAILTLLIGICKEAYDYFTKKGCAEWHDIICDLIGIVVGTFLVGMILIMR